MAITVTDGLSAVIGTAASTWSALSLGGLTNTGTLFVGVGCATGVTVNSVTDDAGNTFSSVARANGPSTNCAELWYANNVSTVTGRVQISLSGASSGAICEVSFSGIRNSSPLNQTGSSAAASGTTSHSASQVTTSSDALGIGFGFLTASTIGSYTDKDSALTWGTGGSTRAHGLYKIYTGGGASTFTCSYTTSSNAGHSVVVGSFHGQSIAAAAAYVISPSFTLIGVQ